MRKQWEVSILLRSIGQWVPSEWVGKQFNDRGKLAYDPEAFALAEDHLIRFQFVADYKGLL